jgi:hypothetical protein
VLLELQGWLLSAMEHPCTSCFACLPLMMAFVVSSRRQMAVFHVKLLCPSREFAESSPGWSIVVESCVEEYCRTVYCQGRPEG